MQLFICDFEIKKDQIILQDQEILYQLRKVLRSKIGDIFFIQKTGYTDCRYELEIQDWDDKTLKGKINKIRNSEFIMQNGKNNKICCEFGMIVCMPNKWDKAEMIVQKLSEIGINEIIFWPSERSVIKDIKIEKIKRLQKISKEAVEQSFGWSLPNIEFVRDLKNLLENFKLIVFDKTLDARCKIQDAKGGRIYGLVGPEGGLTENDYKKFGNSFEIMSLGENILRMETAAIIGAWEIKNLKCGIGN